MLTVPRPATGETFTARARIPRPTWDQFETYVGDRARSGWIKGFVEAFVDAGQLWVDAARIAHTRGESIWDVVNGALSRYVSRHKDLLED